MTENSKKTKRTCKNKARRTKPSKQDDAPIMITIGSGIAQTRKFKF